MLIANTNTEQYSDTAVPTTSPKPPHARTTDTNANPPKNNINNPNPNPNPPPYKNTLVDDAFFILKKCLRRGLSTMAANVACAIINSASMVLESPYFSSLESIIERLMVYATGIHLMKNALSLPCICHTFPHSFLFPFFASPSSLQSCLL